MIGVFDSGDGGLCTVEKIHELAPYQDVCFLADRENAPYGTKTRGELISLTKRNIKRLKEEGAEKILIACCTASSIFPYLSEEEKRISVPIIEATARAATEKTKLGKIGVIATRATVFSGAFEKSIKEILPDAEVFTEEAQDLVSLIEGGARDGSVKGHTLQKIEKTLSKIKNYSFDVLVLGCTHFPRLEKTISQIISCETVSSSFIGAQEILRHTEGKGSGKTVFL